MNCESKICVLENVQQLIVFMSYQSVRNSSGLGFFFFFFASYLLVVVVLAG